ncbi:hypothetical protein N7512_003953 [Penicillium capsulatum]|nr:hypothetical protein N7512_003953 [Penicillium capsulatum]
MDGQPKPTRPPSGIPRLASRLPLPTSSASKPIRPSPSRERLQADPGLDDRRLRRPSYESLLKKPSSRYLSPAKPLHDAVPETQEPAGATDEAPTPEYESSIVGDDESLSAHETRGRSRPSLSERTIETIAHIPPSPASVKRQSSFFNGASPIRSPSRTPSNVSNYSRSPSRSSTNGSELLAQPVSKLRLPSRSRMSIASPSALPTGNNPDGIDSPSKIRQPSVRQSIAGGISEIGAPPKKTMPGKASKPSSQAPAAKPQRARPSPSVSSKSSISDMGPPERPLQVRKTRKPQPESPSAMRSPSTVSRYVSAASTVPDELTPEQQAENDSRKASKSSNALRESIAKAKAARKAAASDKNAVSQENSTDPWGEVQTEDPFNQLPKGSNTGVLRKRVETARALGTLNIAALSLKEIPQEVIKMYEFDPESTSNWFENVDLVKFIAADNELTELPEAVFPDVSIDDIDLDNDESGPQFGGVEFLDLHGNMLNTLPMGLRRLPNLRFLNLSNNALSMEKLDVIMEIPSLVDLRLANNQLEGSFPSSVGRLTKLEALDLRANALTDLPEELGELTSLKTLDVGENHLTSLPFEALSKLPLVTLNAPKNNLGGTLIPSSVDCLSSLQSLNITHNAVEVFTTNDSLALPSLHSLFVSVNRIRNFPSVSSWQSLLVFSAEDNKLSELPNGFVELKLLKSANFTGNDITRLEDRIGLMDNLSSFLRKLLNMNTDEIKSDMRNRCEPDPQDTDDEGSVATHFTLAPEDPSHGEVWKVKPGGVLDRSYSDLRDVEVENLEMINTDEIRCLYLQNNELNSFPVPALKILAQGLTELDLSNNPLDSSDLLSSPLELPKLQTLSLTAAGLTSLEPLLAHLNAPSLTVLDVSKNRLTGSLPQVRQSFPELKSFIASDNQISILEFEAVQGLQSLDVSNNDIDSLPPRIGLLAAERSPKNWGTGSALRRFEVSGNRFRVPRWQIVTKGTDAVLGYLREHIPSRDLPEWEQEDQVNEEF